MKNIFIVFLRHAVRGILTLIGITMLSFLLGQIAPGDLAYSLLSSDNMGEPTEAQLQAVREELGIDKPVIEQYRRWVTQLFRGNIGTSHITNRLIQKELQLRIPVTLKLSALAMFIMMLISLPLGFLLALYKDRPIDHFFLWFTSLFSAIPSFLIALFFMFIFAEILKWLPTSGYQGFSSFILPALSISLGSSMMITRILRADLLGTFGEEYFTVARSKGFSFRFAAWKHALPNALGSVLTLWSNYLLAILGGSTVAESIFALPGLGQWILRSIHAHDYPAIQAYVLVMGVLCLFIYLFTDLLQLLLQPKLRSSS